MPNCIAAKCRRSMRSFPSTGESTKTPRPSISIIEHGNTSPLTSSTLTTGGSGSSAPTANSTFSTIAPRNRNGSCESSLCNSSTPSSPIERITPVRRSAPLVKVTTSARNTPTSKAAAIIQDQISIAVFIFRKSASIGNSAPRKARHPRC